MGRCFLQWRLQPLAARSRLMCSYTGQDDPDRMKLELLSEEEVIDLLSTLAKRAKPGELEVFAAMPQPHGVGNPLVCL
jgi:hypothetical protein